MEAKISGDDGSDSYEDGDHGSDSDGEDYENDVRKAAVMIVATR